MTTDYLANRYGKTQAKARKQRVLWVSVGSLLVIAFFTWSIAVNFAAPAAITAVVENFDVTGQSQTKVTIQVTNPTGNDGICAVKILNKGFTVVGYKELAISAKLGKAASLETSINTTDLGVSASISSCWLK